MSTKTNLKRIALVAVSAIGLSLVSVSPSQAAEVGAGSITALTLSETTAGSSVVTTGGTAANLTPKISTNTTPASGETITIRATLTSKPALSAAGVTAVQVANSPVATAVSVATGTNTPVASLIVTVPGGGGAAALDSLTLATMGRFTVSADVAGTYELTTWWDRNENSLYEIGEAFATAEITATDPAAVNGTVAISAPSAISSGAATNLFVGSSVSIPTPAYSFTATTTPANVTGVNGTASHVLTATVSGPAAPSATAFTTPAATSGTVANATVATPVQGGTTGGARTLTTTVTSAGNAGASLISVSAASFNFTPITAGTYTVTFSGAGLTTYVVSAVVVNNTSRALWEAGAGSTVTPGTGTRSATTGNYSIPAIVTGSLQYAVLTPTAGTAANAFLMADGLTALTNVAGNFNSLTITSGNATFANSTGGFPNGTYNLGSTLGSATSITYGNQAALTASQVWVNAPVAGGTVTLEWRGVRTDPTSLLTSSTLFQTITIVYSAPGAVNEAKSTAVITGVNPGSASGVVDDGLEGILAPMTLASAGGVTSGIGTAKAVIAVSLKDVDGAALIGTLPSVGASIEGPGTLSLSVNNGTANSDASTGRMLVVPAAAAGTAGSPFAAGSSTFYINVFSDGTNGVATVNIWVGGKIWKTKEVSFYGAVSKLTASSDRKVLKAGATSPTTPCVLVATCDSSTVALTPAVQVVATDDKSIAVPYRSYTAVPDKTVITGSAKTSNDVDADVIGATWFDLTTSPNAVSGNTGSVSYTVTLADGVTKIASNAVSFAIGGAPVAVTVALASGASTDVGAQSSLVFTDKDAANNAPYDLDVPLALKSNVALVVGTSANTAGTALPASIAMIGGTGTIKFFNPLVPGNVTISGLAAGLIPVSVSFEVKNASADAQSAAAIAAAEAAADAAAEAIDAANAATDAANLAAEAADAATVAAEEARDAADAATAAVEELATQVATLMAALKAQITTLANTVAKIAKKVKA